MGRINWRGYDPSLAEEHLARQERMDAARLGQLAQLGDIQAQGIRDLGDAASSTVDNLASGIMKGRADKREKEAHDRRMELSEENLTDQQTERNLLDQAEEGQPSLRKKLLESKLEKGKTTSETAQWQDTNQLDAQGRPIMFNRVTGTYKSGDIAAKQKPSETDKPQLVTYTDAQGNTVQEFVTPRAGQRFTGKPETKAPPGESQLDKEFAKDLNEWDARGKSTFTTNMSRLKSVRDQLQADIDTKKDPRGMLGRGAGIAPDFIKPEKSVVLRDTVRAAAQGSLRATLGPAFTEREGERIMNQAYDESLSPKENLKRINLAIQELESNASSMENRAAHFRANKSLSGFSPSATAVATQPPVPEEPAPGTALAAPKVQTPLGTERIINGVKMRKVEGGWVPAQAQ